MTESWLWVTAYQAPGREVMQAQRNGQDVVFEFTPAGVVKRDKSAIDAVRREDCTLRFYSIRDPF